MLLPTALIALLAVNNALALPVATTYDPEYLTPRTWNKVAEMLPTFKREKDFDSYGRYTVFTFKPGDPWLSKANSGDPKMKGQFLDVGNVCSILSFPYYLIMRLLPSDMTAARFRGRPLPSLPR